MKDTNSIEDEQTELKTGACIGNVRVENIL